MKEDFADEENLIEEEDLDEEPGEATEEKKHFDKIMLKYIKNDKIADFLKSQSDNLPIYMKRPARKQLEKSIAETYAYKQGDEEYNIWYDKFLTETKVKDKEAALTRCDPDRDCGYTKGDLQEKFSTYFCKHFAVGSCCEGVNCRYFHHIPSTQECFAVDHSRDIFGRPRYANHREDMEGIGSFLKESRTILISDFSMPTGGSDPVMQMYEILWRHFSVWGRIEDINLLPDKGQAYIKFEHRCMAEFAKEAMTHQALDANEIILVKWSLEDLNLQKDDEVEEKEVRDKITGKVKKKDRKRKKPPRLLRQLLNEDINTGGPKIVQKGMADPQMEKDREYMVTKKQEIKEACKKMSDVLKRIEANQEINETKKATMDELLTKPETKKKYYLPPDLNNEPLILARKVKR